VEAGNDQKIEFTNQTVLQKPPVSSTHTLSWTQKKDKQITINTFIDSVIYVQTERKMFNKTSSNKLQMK